MPVICLVILMSAAGVKHATMVPGRQIVRVHDDLIQINIGEYLDAAKKKFPVDNNLHVRYVNSNNCIYKGK